MGRDLAAVVRLENLTGAAPERRQGLLTWAGWVAASFRASQLSPGPRGTLIRHSVKQRRGRGPCSSCLSSLAFWALSGVCSQTRGSGEWEGSRVDVLINTFQPHHLCRGSGWVVLSFVCPKGPWGRSFNSVQALLKVGTPQLMLPGKEKCGFLLLSLCPSGLQVFSLSVSWTLHWLQR